MTKRAHILHVLAAVVLTVLAILARDLADPNGVLAHYAWTAPALVVTNYLIQLVRAYGSGGPPATALVLIVVVGKVLAGLCVLVALASLASGCSLFSKNPLVPTVPDGGFADASPGTQFVDCTETAVHAGALNLIPTVENGLAAGNLDAALVAAGYNLALPLVLAEAACAVDYVIDEAEGFARTAPDALEATKATNGRAWLAAHHVAFAGDAGSP